MCFSNLPIEFDEDGDPHLAEAAEAVSEPGECDHEGSAPEGTDCGCTGVDTTESDADVIHEADSDEAFAEILDEVSEATRTHLADGTDETADPEPARRRDSAEGD